MTTASRRIFTLALFTAALSACANTTPGTSGETHFVCKATPECAEHGSGLECVGGYCTRPSSMSETTAPMDSATGPRARAAMTFTMEPAAGNVCTTTNGQLSFPSKYNTTVYTELACDVTTGCKPDERVVVDGSDGATVSCRVSRNLNTTGFVLSLNLSVDGSAGDGIAVSFQASGIISSRGGAVTLTESNTVAGGGGSDPECMLSIDPPFGAVAEGNIWATFACTLRNADHPADACMTRGMFLFENCSS